MLSDGLVTLRPRRPEDRAALIAGRDETGRAFLGEPGTDPRPAFCILAGDELAGWIDYDRDEEHDWLEENEVNVGYELFSRFRGGGLLTRSLRLVLHHLSVEGLAATASVLVDPANASSLAVARRTGFSPAGELQGQRYLRRGLPPLVFGDGAVSIRRQRPTDLERHLEAIDDAQLIWLWGPEGRAAWAKMTAREQRAHQLVHLERSEASFGRGPKWRFSVDAGEEAYACYVDCDLANPLVPAGEANIAYVTHPAFRRRGVASRAVRLVLSFLAECTGAEEAHLIVDAENEASLGVARSVGALAQGHLVDHGRQMIRLVVAVTRPEN